MIGIVGPGALGHMLSFFIQKAGNTPVQLIGRQGPQEIHAEIFWENSWQSCEVPLSDEPCDMLLVVVKSYDLLVALENSLPRLKAGGVLVLLGNGYLEALVSELRQGQTQVLWRKGLVTRGVRLEGEKRFVLSSEGKILWGGRDPVHPLEQNLFDALQSFGFGWAQDACELRREKWFFNTVLNTLTGVYHLPSNGDALRLFAQELEVLAEEVFALGQELWPDWTKSWDQLWIRLLQLIKATENNENSMARDVRLGRRTEAAVLSGCLALAKNRSAYPLLEGFDRRLVSR